MRTVFVLLLLANLTLFGYTWLDGGAGGEAVRLNEQVQPDKIKLLTPQEVAALGPAKVAALADVCIEWGPFGEAERRVSELRAQGVRDLSIVDAGSGRFTVAIGLFRNEDAARVHAAELTRQGVIGTATATARPQPVSLTLIVVRDPPANVVARLRELQPS